MDRGDLEREQDIEELRRIALAQHAQLQLLIELVERQRRELGRSATKKGDFQLTLKMLEELKAKAKQTHDALSKAEPKRTPAPRASTGPTNQLRLPIVEREFLLDEPDRTCPSCGGELRVMAGQFDESEMIDVVEVSYQLVKVKQQKYVCRCGSCVETALGPERALPGSRYSLAFAIKVLLTNASHCTFFRKRVVLPTRHPRTRLLRWAERTVHFRRPEAQDPIGHGTSRIAPADQVDLQVRHGAGVP